jgi:redox-sensitive bicupin YhaK (pirin superfamily)
MSRTDTDLQSPAPTRLALHRQRMGAGLTVSGLRGAAAQIDPFIAVDHFHMTQPTFPPHPHAGFSAVTYLFDDAETGFLNRDSLGHEGPIRPGELHWTLAGSGVMHEEFPLESGRIAHGLQIFVNLPSSTKLQAPRALHLAAADMPITQGEGWTARQVFGRLGEAVAPLDLPVDAALTVVDVAEGARYTPALGAGRTGFAMLIRGEAVVGLHQFLQGEALTLPAGATLHARGGPLRLALFSGTPLGEPVVQHGPFVMNTEAQIVDAMRRYQRGEMGRLATAVAA